jgi:DNA-binding MarR family transcriptional regulator
VNRQEVIEQVLAELAANAPTRMMRSMRHWPAGRLSLIHLHVLMLLADEGPQPMRALADTLDVSQASVTGIVDRMEQRGLVERQRDESDRRVIRVGLSEGGQQILSGMGTERRGHLAALLAELTDDELAGLLKGTRALHRARERMHANEADHHPLDGREADCRPAPSTAQEASR